MLSPKKTAKIFKKHLGQKSRSGVHQHPGSFRVVRCPVIGDDLQSVCRDDFGFELSSIEICIDFCDEERITVSKLEHC